MSLVWFHNRTARAQGQGNETADCGEGKGATEPIPAGPHLNSRMLVSGVNDARVEEARTKDGETQDRKRPHAKERTRIDATELEVLAALGGGVGRRRHIVKRHHQPTFRTLRPLGLDGRCRAHGLRCARHSIPPPLDVDPTCPPVGATHVSVLVSGASGGWAHRCAPYEGSRQVEAEPVGVDLCVRPGLGREGRAHAPVPGVPGGSPSLRLPPSRALR